MAGRVVEAFVGEYASGKSENAINRSLQLLERGDTVLLVDLDLVEPFYTLRPIKKQLEDLGLQVIAWDREDSLGFGETGTLLKAEVKGVLAHPGDLILDVGYGTGGSKSLNLIEGLPAVPELQIYLVVNASRPMTATVENIITYAQSFSHLDGLINNTHLGSETTADIVQEGARRVKEAADKLGLPLIWTSAVGPVAEQLGPRDNTGTPVRRMTRFMEGAIY